MAKQTVDSEGNVLRPQDITPKKGINWEAVKTNVITGFVCITLGLVGGYFLAINIDGEARSAVYSDIQLVSKEVK
jgi:hypothetical protein